MEKFEGAIPSRFVVICQFQLFWEYCYVSMFVDSTKHI